MKRKLMLSTETVRILRGWELARVAGGLGTDIGSQITERNDFHRETETCGDSWTCEPKPTTFIRAMPVPWDPAQPNKA